MFLLSVVNCIFGKKRTHGKEQELLLFIMACSTVCVMLVVVAMIVSVYLSCLRLTLETFSDKEMQKEKKWIKETGK